MSANVATDDGRFSQTIVTGHDDRNYLRNERSSVRRRVSTAAEAAAASCAWKRKAIAMQCSRRRLSE